MQATSAKTTKQGSPINWARVIAAAAAAKADRERTAAGKGVSLAGQVKRLKFGLYTVPSQSEPGVYWTVVERADGGLQCTCGAGMFGRPCAHLAAVTVRRQQEAKRRQQRKQAA